MDRSQNSSSPSDGSAQLSSSSSSSPSKGVISIECLTGSSKADEWTGDLLQTGDIVEELKIGSLIVTAPFKNGRSGVQRILHNSFKQKETSIRVRVRRGSDECAELQACIVPGDQLVGKKQYVLRAIDDPNYAVGFFDRTESECLNLQASRTSRMVSALERTPLQDGYVSYPWDRRMHEMLSVPNSSSFYSVLFLPKACDKVGSRYNDLEDTLAHAHAWINASQASGAPVVFMNIQTESLLTKISGDTASSTVNAGSLSDLSNLANTSLYGFEDYHGVDIGVVRAVRLWFSPLAGEIPIEIKIKEKDTKLGFAIGRTEEGFIYISSVIESNNDAPSARSGLSNLYKQASAASHLLVVSRISNQKVLPWMVSPTGSIRCFDTVSLSQKLSLHRHARVPILLHVFLWDRSANNANVGSIRARAMSTEVHLTRPINENQVLPLAMDDDSEEYETRVSDRSAIMPERDTAGEFSFRLHDFGVTNNWV
ncbi:hypothetical protein PHJA_002021200 [Phtheirospermum japonicum]|uniref:Uncharacterized protein n=1 Tax=Phtheirospermum japonicum TaxID=374723 RepID=A0A830CSD5_9LAMI|nr:hypothetical protein PHJA_002021200 [Phtheirospermum japonicum]